MTPQPPPRSVLFRKFSRFGRLTHIQYCMYQCNKSAFLVWLYFYIHNIFYIISSKDNVLKTFLGNWTSFISGLHLAHPSRGDKTCFAETDFFIMTQKLFNCGNRGRSLGKIKTESDETFWSHSNYLPSIFHQRRRGDVMVKPLNGNNAIWKAQGVS